MKRPMVLAFLACLVAAGCVPSLAGAGTRGSAAESKTAKKTPSSARTKSRRNYRYPQRAPTRDRYKEIQRALAKRGYDPGPIDGRWGSRTSAALKRFEKDNNLPADGKLDSLVLITLGLGPRRLSSVSSDTGTKE